MPNVETQDVSQDMQVLDMQVWDIPFFEAPFDPSFGKKRRSGLLHDTILVVAKEADPQKYICWICFRLLQPTVHSCDHVVQGVGPTPWYKVRHFSLGRSLNLRIQDQMELPRHPQPWCIMKVSWIFCKMSWTSWNKVKNRIKYVFYKVSQQLVKY